MLLRFRQKLMRWIRESEEALIEEPTPYNPRNKYSNGISVAVAKQPRSGLDSQGISFKVISGQGGIVIESYHHDHRNDDRVTTIHVIPESEDLAVALSHIITLQALRG